MKSFACYCQKCKAANSPGEELCSNCGTPLMLIVTPPSVKNELIGLDVFPQEHLLERISLLELRLMQVTDRLSQALDLMLRQARTVQSEHLLVETLLDALTASGIVESDRLSQIFQEKKRIEEKQISAQLSREKILANVLQNPNSSKFDLFTNLVKEGFGLINKGEEKQGVRTLERAIVLEPKNFQLLSFIGEHYFRHDKRALAREYLQKANAVAPRKKRTALLLGYILADEGEIETAKNLLEPLGEEKSFAANFVLGMMYAAENRLGLTLASFKRALAVLPNAETHYLVGSAYAEMGRENMALRYLQKSVELDANFADAWFMLGVIYIRLGEEKSAKEALAMSLAARDASSAQSHAILRNPKKHSEIGDTSLLFARLRHVKKNLVSGASLRLVRLLREDIENSFLDNPY